MTQRVLPSVSHTVDGTDWLVSASTCQGMVWECAVYRGGPKWDAGPEDKVKGRRCDGRDITGTGCSCVRN